MAAPLEFHVFLPQMRLTLAELVERARAAEAGGLGGMNLMDHLAPPMALDQPMYEAMLTATWLAAHTTTLRVGHLVLCDVFRHPAVLAREAVTLDHASNGRFELGIGWGSVADEFTTFGITAASPAERVARLGESLTVIRALWRGESVTFDGRHHTLAGAMQVPGPLARIPIVIGGTGPKTMALVAEHADWWNVPIHKLADLDEMRPRAGSAKVSVQVMVAYVPSEAERASVTELATRRFGFYGDGLLIGNDAELTDRFHRLAERGIERVYVWFADFAAPPTLRAFGTGVAARFRTS